MTAKRGKALQLAALAREFAEYWHRRRAESSAPAATAGLFALVAAMVLGVLLGRALSD